MATELVLSHQDGRIRIVYQYAPVWEKDIEPGSCPPQGLKLFRILVSKETLRETPPTYQSEQQLQLSNNDIIGSTLYNLNEDDEEEDAYTNGDEKIDKRRGILPRLS